MNLLMKKIISRLKIEEGSFTGDNRTNDEFDRFF